MILYEPSRDAVTDDEKSFLARIAPSGLDWLTTRADFARRHGIGSYYGVWDVVTLPPTRVLSDAPLEFHMYAEQDRMDLPPEYLFASFLASSNARKNHREIVAQMQARLGKPEVCDVSNCLKRKWTFGVFSVEIHTFPPEVQDPALTNTNVLLQREPSLANESSVTIHSEYAHVYPDASLESIAEAVRTDRNGHSLLFMPRFEPWMTRKASPLRATRHNPESLTSALGRNEEVAWVDEPRQRIGLSERSRSLVFERTLATALVLDRVEPCRGSGGSRLELQANVAPTSPDARKSRTLLCDGDRLDTLDETAEKLSSFWNLPVVHESSLDD